VICAAVASSFTEGFSMHLIYVYCDINFWASAFLMIVPKREQLCRSVTVCRMTLPTLMLPLSSPNQVHSTVTDQKRARAFNFFTGAEGTLLRVRPSLTACRSSSI
jgi:hypothetical protein